MTGPKMLCKAQIQGTWNTSSHSVCNTIVMTINWQYVVQFQFIQNH